MRRSLPSSSAHRGRSGARKGIRLLYIQVCALMSVVAWFLIVVYLVQRKKPSLATVQQYDDGLEAAARSRVVMMSVNKKKEVEEEEEETLKVKTKFFFSEEGKRFNTTNCLAILEGSEGFFGMRYWHRVTDVGAAELDYESPYGRTGPGKRKYLSFEVDAGGFNNVRMSFETVAVFAHATGRTLVMPPKQRVYLLKEGHAKNPKAVHGLGAFINIAALGQMIDIIDTNEFFRRERQGIFVNEDYDYLETIAERATETGNLEPRKKLRSILRKKNKHAMQPKWSPMNECLIFGGYGFKSYSDWMNHTDPPWRRLSPYHFCTEKRRLRRLDQETAAIPWIHFQTNASFGYRLFTHWYTFLQFSDGPTDVFYRRFVRDRIRYTHDVFCAAGLVVRRLAAALSLDADTLKKNKKFFSAVHIRRGELQYKRVRISAQAWKHALSQWLLPNEPLFVLSDEKNRSWFQPIAHSFPHLFFLDDLLYDSQLDPNKLGMIEQLVAASAHTRTFTGTHFSTFSAYVARLRAYYRHSSTTFFYAAPPEKHFVMHDYQAGLQPTFPFYNREWSLGWADIDLALPSDHRADPRLTALPPHLHYDDIPFTPTRKQKKVSNATSFPAVPAIAPQISSNKKAIVATTVVR